MWKRLLLTAAWVLALGLLTEGGPAAAPEGEEEGILLPLRTALVEGMENNLDVQIQELNVSKEEENVQVEAAAFDPRLEASFSFQALETPTASAFAQDNVEEFQEVGGTSALRKRFRLGLESGISFESNRSTNNSRVDALRPQYRSVLMLDLTQPLLRDFGVPINTAALRITENQTKQAVHAYTRFAQEIGGQIETAYYDLAGAMEVLAYRSVASREAPSTASKRTTNSPRSTLGVNSVSRN